MNYRCEYFYLIRHIPSGRFYAGSSYKKDCHPSQLWASYFTSSNTVKHLIEADGVNSFEVLEIIPRPLNDAREYEANFLKSFNAARNDMWLNRTNGDAKAYIRGSMSQSHKDAISKSRTGNSKEGIKWTKESRQKLSIARIGIVFSDEHIKNLSLSHQGLTQSDETKLKRSKSMLGKVFTKERCKNISEAKKGKTPETYTCPHCNKIGKGSVMFNWHFDKCKMNV